MSSAGDRRGQWAQAARWLSTVPRLPILAGALLSLVALVQLVARTSMSSTAPVIGGHSGPTQTLLIAGTAVSTQAALVVYLLVLATTVPPVFLRPGSAAVAVTAANVLTLGLFDIVTVAGAIMQLIVLYRFGRSGSRLLAPCLTVPFLAFALVLVGSDPAGGGSGSGSGSGSVFGYGADARVLTILLAVLAPAAAWAGLAHRARHEALVHSAAQEVAATTLLEHTARGERARIARELHDVVAHHISMIAVQAETARLATPGMPDAGAGRLLEIGDTARAALTEMRRLLGVLREDARAAEPVDAATNPPGADRRPQPSLQQLNDLLDNARSAARTGVRLIVSGPPATLDPGVELAAYRIIQEALTNARRHAPGAAVDVELHYSPEVLRLRIRDNGPGPVSAAPVDGHGLLGMRERAGAVGGRLLTGPASVGGFIVEAVLPAQAEAEVA